MVYKLFEWRSCDSTTHLMAVDVGMVHWDRSYSLMFVPSFLFWGLSFSSRDGLYVFPSGDVILDVAIIVGMCLFTYGSSDRG